MRYTAGWRSSSTIRGFRLRLASRLVLSTLALVLAIAPAAWPSPGVRVDPEFVWIEGLSPGGQVAVLGVARRVEGTIPGFERWDGVYEDEDRDGRVSVPFEQPVEPSLATWVAVDLATGEWGVRGPEPPDEETLVEESLAVTEVFAGTELWAVPVGTLEVLVVRPGTGAGAGAWGGVVWDGGMEDGDGLADGWVGVSWASLEAVGASGPSPGAFAAGDVLVAIDPGALLHAVTRVGAPVTEALQ